MSDYTNHPAVREEATQLSRHIGKAFGRLYDIDEQGWLELCQKHIAAAVAKVREEEQYETRLRPEERAALERFDIHALLREVTGETAEDQVKRLSNTAMKFFRECCRLKSSLKTLRRYQAVEFSDGEQGRRIGLAFDGSISAFEFDETYQPWELLEMMEKWLHEKVDAALSTDPSPEALSCARAIYNFDACGGDVRSDWDECVARIIDEAMEPLRRENRELFDALQGLLQHACRPGDDGKFDDLFVAARDKARAALQKGSDHDR